MRTGRSPTKPMHSSILHSSVQSKWFDNSPDFLDAEGKRWRPCGEGADAARAYLRTAVFPVEISWVPPSKKWEDPFDPEVKAHWMGYSSSSGNVRGSHCPYEYSFRQVEVYGPQPD